MKYIIKNKQLFNSIYTFIDREFEGIYWTYGYDYNRDEETIDLVYFRLSEYDDNIFELIQETWYTREFDSPIKGKTRESQEFTDKWLPLSPILHFTDDGVNIKRKLNNFFKDYWKPVFKKWFENKFPQFPVKTYLFQ